MSTKKLLKRPAKTLSKKTKTLTKKRERKISTACPPDTTFVLEAGAKYMTMMSVMPDGTRTAWSNCGRCSRHVHNCQCREGVAAPRSVEWCYDRSVAALAKEEWDHKHPNYYGSLLSAQRKSSRRDHIPVMPTMPKRDDRKKPWEEIDIPPKGKPLKPMAKEATDAGAMEATAKKMAKSAEKQMLKATKTLSKPKTLKKTLKKTKTLKKVK